MYEYDNDSVEREQRLRLLISKGAELAGGAAGPAVGTVLGTLLAGPAGAAVGGTVGAAATIAVKAIGHDLSSRVLSARGASQGWRCVHSCRSRDRLSVAETAKAFGMTVSLALGDGVRSDAEEVWESTLLKSQREPEERKLPYMAHLLANLAFQLRDHCCHGTSNDKGGPSP